MSSGVKVSKDCLTEYEKLKMKHEYRYIIFKLNDKMTEVVVDAIGEKAETYEDMKRLLQEAGARGECRYAVLDLDFTFKEKARNKIIFISWAPDNAKTKQKMVYTSSKDYIKKALQVEIDCQATDDDEMSMETITEKASRGLKD